MIEDLKPIAGFSITQIGVLKERDFNAAVNNVVLNTQNHKKFLFLDPNQRI